jgi:hypothetical protein
VVGDQSDKLEAAIRHELGADQVPLGAAAATETSLGCVVSASLRRQAVQ